MLVLCWCCLRYWFTGAWVLFILLLLLSACKDCISLVILVWWVRSGSVVKGPHSENVLFLTGPWGCHCTTAVQFWGQQWILWASCNCCRSVSTRCWGGAARWVEAWWPGDIEWKSISRYWLSYGRHCRKLTDTHCTRRSDTYASLSNCIHFGCPWESKWKRCRLAGCSCDWRRHQVYRCQQWFRNRDP